MRRRFLHDNNIYRNNRKNSSNHKKKRLESIQNEEHVISTTNRVQEIRNNNNNGYYEDYHYYEYYGDDEHEDLLPKRLSSKEFIACRVGYNRKNLDDTKSKKVYRHRRYRGQRWKNGDSLNTVKNSPNADHVHLVQKSRHVATPSDTKYILGGSEDITADNYEQAERFEADFESCSGPSFENRKNNVTHALRSRRQENKHIRSRRQEKKKKNAVLSRGRNNHFRRARTRVQEELPIATLVQEELPIATLVQEELASYVERNVRFTSESDHDASEVTSQAFYDARTVAEGGTSDGERSQRRFPRIFSRMCALYRDRARVNKSGQNNERRRQRRIQSRNQQRQSSGSSVIPSCVVNDAWPIQEEDISLVEQQSSTSDILENITRKESSSSIDIGSSLQDGKRHFLNSRIRSASHDNTNLASDRLSLQKRMSIHKSVASYEDASSKLVFKTAMNNKQIKLSPVETPESKERKVSLPTVHLEWSDEASSWVSTTAWYRPLYSWEATVCISWTFSSERNPNEIWGRIIDRIVCSSMDRSLIVDKVQCWIDAMAIVIGQTETFLHYKTLYDCKRILACARGDGELSGRTIWNSGGFQAVVDAIDLVLYQVEAEKEIICPTCLEVGSPDTAHRLNYDDVATDANCHRPFAMCSRGHRVDTQLLSGRFFNYKTDLHPTSLCLCLALTSLFPAIIQVLVWDDVGYRGTSLGSGFIVDAERGLVVTAAHVIFHMDTKNGLFGKQRGKAIIGIMTNGYVASFRYFATPVAQDIRNVDACILRIRTRLKKDVNSINDLASIEDTGHLLDVDNPISNEKLNSLPLTDCFLLEEHVRIFGFNQGEYTVTDSYDDKRQEFDSIFHSINVSKGYVCRYFEKSDYMQLAKPSLMTTSVGFDARKELVINCCDTINGDSGGPCVNNEGKVIGILSRGLRNKSYLVPSSEIKQLIQSCIF